MMAVCNKKSGGRQLHTLFSNLGFPAKMIQQKKFRKHGNCGNQIQPAHNRNHVMFAYQNNGQW